MLNTNIRETLENLKVSAEEIERVESIIAKYSTVNRTIIKSLYEDASIRRTMKSNGLWDSKTTGIEFEERYLGKAECEVIRQKLWTGGNKIRVYFDVEVDGLIKDAGRFINIT